MSPGKLKGSRSKDSSTRAPNERQKSSSKQYTSRDNDAISQKSGYSPMSGAICSLESILVGSPAHQNDGGHVRNMDDRNDQSSRSPRAVTEYDVLSNNGSWSGESEDPKEKSSPTLRQEVGARDSDRREKIRLKNERKHQRQKERRAQELHERCCGYLTSRKLEGLAQQLVAMGFSSERATLALILNEGKVEKSVAWLFDVSEEEAQRRGASVENGSNLKIDISEELCRVAAMEVKYKSSKQEVERAIVSCEGDLDRAEEILKAQKPERPCTPSKNEAHTPGREKLMKPESPTIPVTIHKSVVQPHTTPTKMGAAVMIAHDVSFSKNLQALNSTHPRLIGNGWMSNDSFPPLPSTEAASGIMAKEERRTQRAATLDQEAKIKHIKQLNSMPRFFLNRNGLSPRWHAKSTSGIDVTTSGQPYCYSGKKSPSPVPFGLSEANGAEQLRPAIHSLPSSLMVPSSLGLFSSWTTSGSSGGGVDWNMGSSMAECDYATIDWSIRPNSLCSKRHGLWLGISSCLRDDGWGGAGLRNGGVISEMGSPASEGDWTSPFAGNDIFSVPRQFMASSL